MPTCWGSLSGCSMLLWAMAGSATWRLRLLTWPSGWSLLAFYIVGNGISRYESLRLLPCNNKLLQKNVMQDMMLSLNL